jgi:phospholipid/cholesterol/gamma-HCH transport system substrate-binding protein
MAARPLHRDHARRIVIGIGVILGFILVGYIGGLVQTGGALPGMSYRYVTASFEDVGTLKTGKQVKQNGVPVGTVSKIEYVDGLAEVTLRLDGGTKVYQDAAATVGNSSALGKKFLDFDAGTPAAGELGKNEKIGVEQTTAATSLEDILDILDPETRAALKSTLKETSTGLAGHGDDLNVLLRTAPGLLVELQKVSAHVTSPDADLAGLLNSADVLVSRFEGREDQIASLLRNLDDTVGALGTDNGEPLQETVANLPSTLGETKKALDLLQPPLVDARAAVSDLRPGTQALGQSSPDLRSFLRGSVKPLDRVPAIGKQATPIVTDLTRTLRDARPLVRPVTDTVSSLDQLLFQFAPYAGDAGRFFSQHDLLSGTLGSDDKHYFAAALTGVGLFSVDGIPDPLYRSEPYPCPGTAFNHATRTDCSGGAR